MRHCRTRSKILKSRNKVGIFIWRKQLRISGKGRIINKRLLEKYLRRISKFVQLEDYSVIIRFLWRDSQN